MNKLTVTKGTTKLLEETSAFDLNRNITSVTSANGQKIYTYDETNQLLSQTHPNGQFSESYSYDVLGNRLSKTTMKNGVYSNINYQYDNNNRLTYVNSQPYIFDDNGNRTKDTKYTYEYNSFDQITSIKNNAGNVIASYNYDDKGRRKSKTVTGKTTYYHYDKGTNILFETDSIGNITADYIYDSEGMPLIMTKNGQNYYYVYNINKEITSLTNASGDVVASYSYDAWGNILSQSGTMATDNPLRYKGYQYDDETGLYYLIARYYQPEEGVFLTADPEGGDTANQHTQNGYNYANNNPIMLFDPDGNAALALGLIFIPGVGQAVLITGGVIIAGGLAYSAGSWIGKKGQAIYAEKVRSKYPAGKRYTYNTRKAAEQAARKAGGNKKPVNHSNNEKKPHFHPNVPKGNSKHHDHYYYPKHSR